MKPIKQLTRMLGQTPEHHNKLKATKGVFRNDKVHKQTLNAHWINDALNIYPIYLHMHHNTMQAN